MELGLRLGEAPKPFSFMDTSTEMSKGFGPCLGLGVGLYTKGEERASVDTPVQLDLLPLVPVPRYPPPHLMFSLPTENRVSESGVSGNLTTNRGFDVNHLPSTEDIDDRAAASSPNSAVSSYQMDFSIYTRGGSKRNAEDAALNEVETERASSRASDDEENGLARKKLRLSKEQSAFLEESFKENNTLNPKQKLALAKRLSLRPRQVEVWFQNRRARTKLKQTEVDCEYLKRCCETLTEENRRLHKELQELKALKTTNPFHMQLPATTLTMCPSCERVATTTTTTNNETTQKTATLQATNRPWFFPLSQPAD
ncbi:hypothetical protein AAC387_Pa02g5135 [Persea americana]